jgi:hypothetical protein
MKRLAWGCLVFCALLLGAVDATRPPSPPEKKSVVGYWAGYEDEFPYFYRLNMRSDYTGTLIVFMPRERADKYRVRWSVEGSTISLQLSGISAQTFDRNCLVQSFSSRAMHLIVGGRSNEWKRAVTLFNEESLRARVGEAAKQEHSFK